MLKRDIRRWRQTAEQNYRNGFMDRLAGERCRPNPVPGGAYDSGMKEADRVRRGKWPAELELPAKVWARYLARQLGQL